MLNLCNWLSVKQLIVFHDLLLVFKIRKDKKPAHLYNKLSSEYNYRTRYSINNEIRQTHIPKSEIYESSFVHRAVSAWNALPTEITNISEIHKFKSNLRNWVKNNVDI